MAARAFTPEIQSRDSLLAAASGTRLVVGVGEVSQSVSKCLRWCSSNCRILTREENQQARRSVLGTAVLQATEFGGLAATGHETGISEKRFSARTLGSSKSMTTASSNTARLYFTQGQPPR
jgi:hypothetical protein